MGAIRRCLIHGHRPERVVDMVKEMVARGAQIVSAGRTTAALRSFGIPTDEAPLLTAPESDRAETLQLLHPRIHGGLLGDWDDPDQRADLERQGVKRIDLVMVDLPERPAGDRALGLDGADLGAIAVLRSAASNPRWVTALCDPADFQSVVGELDGQGEVSQALRDRLARKALQALAGLDAVVAADGPAQTGAPEAWSFQARIFEGAPVQATGSGRAGLYRISGDSSDLAELTLLSGPPLTPAVLADADWVDALLEGVAGKAVAIVHNGCPCGFALAGEGGVLEDAFARARSTDPRGAFGGVVGFNREVDPATASVLADAYLEAVLAPDFSAEARAQLGRTRTRLLRVAGGGQPSPICRSTRWGVLLDWPAGGPSEASLRTLSQRAPGDEELSALRLAWHLAIRLSPVAVVIAAPDQLLAAGVGQASWLDAARLASWKVPAGSHVLAAASAEPIRFADDLNRLAEVGVTAVAFGAGSPREAEVTQRADGLSMAVQVEQIEADQDRPPR